MGPELKLKVISADWHEIDLENAVNDWLSNNAVTIHEIKVSSLSKKRQHGTSVEYMDIPVMYLFYFDQEVHEGPQSFDDIKDLPQGHFGDPDYL